MITVLAVDTLLGVDQITVPTPENEQSFRYDSLSATSNFRTRKIHGV
jgi:hypothetical protein